MSTQRYKCMIQYDGTNYVGYQIQKNGISVQEVIQKALKKMFKGQKILIEASGRTDSGVHALGQVIHFECPANIEPIHLQRALNSLLPADISIKHTERVSDEFHSRFHAKGKKYMYRVDLNRFADPFKRLYTLHHPYRIDLVKLQQALDKLVGEHDFTSFCSTKTIKEDKVRTVYQAKYEMDEEKNELVFTFVGNGFLYNMVRIFVGTCLQIADGLKEPEEIDRLFEVKDRNEAGPTASGKGLYLVEVYYDNQFLEKLEKRTSPPWPMKK
ncbi:tRNA pseudouridine(38-40) synthase TruA [Jeotgalibaca ciconiae]|uniref:tRNA pseudouridine synthase A n=1 Tax=Jeotgalibaca ciconiae TaxID=2496265 RepID=A0A3Q9BJH3_9LACT|nr:tRNA pseudouridine(38-40) synthase TruA [Jeotgalibaca ciconiae]AZP03788.1 tRNA pseudouridine(38-40) synthase TruA [Jeotgalibaca ciconiae]